MKFKTHLTHFMLITLCLGFIPQKASAMDDIDFEEYATFAQMGTAIGTVLLGGTVAWLINKCCKSPQDRNDALSISLSDASPISFDMWKMACDILPKENESYRQTSLSLDMLMKVVREFTHYTQEESSLINPDNWLGIAPPKEALINDAFMPYAQKLCVDPGAEVAFHGDLHGDIHAFNSYIADLNAKGYLDGFKIAQDNFYMLFLGDYTDRGYYGAEVWYTILRLKLANPKHVFMVRGNHEDAQLNASYGFTHELQAKFGAGDNNIYYKELHNLYNLLPVVLYLGSGTDEQINFLQCCHGGLELGFDPKPLLHTPDPLKYTMILSQEGRFDRAPGLKQLSKDIQKAITEKIPACILGPCKLIKPRNIIGGAKCIYQNETWPVGNYMGFMWNDFIVDNTTIIDYSPGRGWVCGRTLTHDVLHSHSTGTHKVRGVFRAHQHGDCDMMLRILNRDNQGHADDAGVGKLWTDHEHIKQSGALWDGIVCTFLVAPSVYGQHPETPFNYDAFGLLKTAESFDDWHLKVTRIDQSSTSMKTRSLASSSSSSAASSSSSTRVTRQQAHFFEDIGN